MHRFTLSKDERLSSRKAIGLLFETGESIAVFPIRLVWKKVEPEEVTTGPLQVMFSVSKKKFPRAVDRNRIRRLMREHYRLIKPALYERLGYGGQYHLALLYTGHEVPAFAAIQKSINGALERWLKNILSHSS